MATRDAACSCGQLRLEAVGDPMRISIGHCLACQRRTGSAFGVQAAFAPDQVRVTGRYSDYERAPDLRGLAADDSDLDAIRADLAFAELIG